MPLTQVLSDGTDSYLYGLGRIGEQAGSDWEYYLGDALGSVRQLVDNTGAISLAQTYQPYGEVLSSYGDAASSYGFTGEMSDSNGLIYLRSRYLDPGIGRFLTKDVWQGNYKKPLSLNRYNYVGGNPVNRVDPTGMYWWGPGLALFDASELRAQSQNIHIRIQAIWMAGRMNQIHAEYPGNSFIPVPKVDLLDSVSGEVWEIKPWDEALVGARDIAIRVIALNMAQENELLMGMNPVAMPYNWNHSPAMWLNGRSFPSEIYIGTDASGWFDFYAGQISPGIILWWKFPRNAPRTVPFPIVLPNDVTWSERNRRNGWSPQGVPVPVYSEGATFTEFDLSVPNPEENLAQIILLTCAILGKEIIEVAICGPCAVVIP